MSEDSSNTDNKVPITFIVPKNSRSTTDIDYHQEMLWQMRKSFFMVCVTLCFILTIGALITSLLVFWLTKNYYSFFLSAPITITLYFMRKFSKFLLSKDDLPMEEKRFQLEAMQIQAGKQKSSKIIRMIKKED